MSVMKKEEAREIVRDVRPCPPVDGRKGPGNDELFEPVVLKDRGDCPCNDRRIGSGWPILFGKKLPIAAAAVLGGVRFCCKPGKLNERGKSGYGKKIANRHTGRDGDSRCVGKTLSIGEVAGH